MSSASSLGELLEAHAIDVAFITEHKLFEHSKRFMSSINTNYKDITYCDPDYDMYSNISCGKGGVSVLYKTTLAFSVRIMDEIASERLIGIELACHDNANIFAFCIYMPSSNYSTDIYIDHINNLQAVCNTYSEKGTVVFLGDMNGEIIPFTNSKYCSSRDRTLTRFLSQNDMFSLTYLPSRIGPPFTFLTMEKMLDHVIMFNTDSDLISEVRILDDDMYHVSDHLPIIITLNVPIYHTNVKERAAHTAWHKITSSHVEAYQLTLSELSHNLPTDDINVMYEYIVKSILTASQSTLPKSTYNRHSKPYWTKDVKLSHENQRKCRRIWIAQGRPRGHKYPSYTNYKNAKRCFTKTQKRAIACVEQTFVMQLNESAECDNKLFWSLVKRRKGKKQLTCNQLITESGITRDPSQISEGFTNYYTQLYSPLNEDHFDNEFKLHIENEISKLGNSNQSSRNEPSIDPILTVSTIENYSRSLKNKKAASYDLIYNEHIKYGGTALFGVLTKLFNRMIETEQIPCACKRGMIIPIYKDNGKSRADPKNYRPITLLPVIYKLFEKVLHYILTKWISEKEINFPHGQQNAYQKHTGAITASFILQESIHHNNELGSKVYVATLDTKQAFDTVWLPGVFHKLSTLGIKGRMWSILVDAHSNMTSCVLANGIRSPTFLVQQGIRQGGIISTWIYNLFVDELLSKLQDSGLGTTVLNISTSNVTLADDITLSATSPINLQKMLDIVHQYTCMFRYVINATKSFVIIFGHTSRRQQNVDLSMGPDKITVTDNIRHVGVHLNSKMTDSDKVDNGCKKAKSSLFSLLTVNIDHKYLNPIHSASLITRICIPTLLFGSELWCNLKACDIEKLERFLRLAAKKVQHFHVRTRTDISLSMLGWMPIAAQIEMNKLSLLGRLCNMPGTVLAKNVFNTRLSLYTCRTDANQRGFIPDIIKILHKYGLTNTVTNYVNTGIFPNKNEWRVKCKSCVYATETELWRLRLNDDDSFARFRFLHTNIETSVLWECASEPNEILNAYNVSNLWVETSSTNMTNQHQSVLCHVCGLFYNDITLHTIIECTQTENLRH
ncbi:MAG: reverse transcriptase family protein, partial [Sedimenticola sp.]